MKIINTSFRNILGIAVAASSIAVGSQFTQNNQKTQHKTPIDTTLVKNDSNVVNKDSLILNMDTVDFSFKIPPKGTINDTVLMFAPSPEITIKGEKKSAAIVVDLSKNVLYQYNKKGEPFCAYRVASGKKSSPTDEGIRVVTHVEKYPYKTAPESSKRRQNPNDYGPRVICLETVDPDTGVRGKTGEFIHGNNNPKSLGKYASKGCIRMDNSIIKKIAQEVQKGDFVLIKKF